MRPLFLICKKFLQRPTIYPKTGEGRTGMSADGGDQDQDYVRAVGEFGPALQRLAMGYEADADLRRDLLQDIHLALWRSFKIYDRRCSLRTWVYRVAHNVAASHIVSSRQNAVMTDLDALANVAATDNPEQAAADRQTLDMVMALLRHLKPPDRQMMLLYLEDLDATTIGEVTGLSPRAVATKIHRVKAVLARHYRSGVAHVN